MSEIKLCGRCNGKSTIKTIVSYGHNGNEYETIKCDNCNGTGRVKIGNYSYEVPFDTSDSKIYNIDSKLHHLIREFESKHKK